MDVNANIIKRFVIYMAILTFIMFTVWGFVKSFMNRPPGDYETEVCDIRLKDNIELVGKSKSDINIYNFTYLNDPTVYQGVMAHEVPWASVKHDSGYLMVDYNKVDVDFKSIR